MTVRFDTYSEYANTLISEKMTLAHVHAFQKVFNFTLDSGDLYYKVVDNVVTGVKRAGVTLTSVSSVVEVDDDTKFYYEISSKRLYLFDDAASLEDQDIILEIRFFFSDAPINLSWDLGDDSEEVEYIPRLKKAPGFKSEIGTDQQGISVTGSGSLQLENSDGYLDSIYDTYFFEEKRVEIYSFHRDLLPSEAKLLYRGFISGKSFTESSVSFTISDSLFKLDQKIPLVALTSADGVSEAFEGEFKRRIYGKVEGLLTRSIDQIGSGYQLTGTVSNDLVGNTTLIGSGTLFLDEVSPNDIITVDGVEYTVETINSDISLSISDSEGIQTIFTTNTVSNVPERPYRKKNRSFIIAGHALKQVSTTVTSQKELNRFDVADPTGIEIGDILQVGVYSVIVKRISGNTITTRFNMLGLQSNGTSVLKEPVQKLYIEDKQIVLSDIDSISNTSNQASVTISDLAEFNLASNKALPSYVSFNWTNGSRTISTSADIDLTQILQSRDWIKRSTEGDLSYLEILSVSEQTIVTRTVYTGSTGAGTASYRLPGLIADDSNISADVLGKTKDGTAFGDPIETAADVIYDLLQESDLSQYIDQTSFDNASQEANHRVSIKLPFNITNKTAPSIRSVVDDLNKTVFGSLVLNNELNLAYNILDVSLPADLNLPIISEDDVIKFRIKGRSSRLYKAAQTLYSFKDYDRFIQASAGKSFEFTSEFVSDFETSNKTADLSLNVFELNSARALTERFVFFNSLSEATIEIDTSLNLVDLNMGDQVILDFNRLYSRLGDSTSRLKVGTVIGIDRTGSDLKIKISDLGNIFNRAATISADDADDYADSDSSELLVSSHITDDNGLVDDEETTYQTNLIT